MEYLLNVFGKDQPGLVAGITDIFYRHGANLGDANMTRLGEAFALILVVSVDQEREASVRGELEQFASNRNLVTTMVPQQGFEGRWGTLPANTLITVYGADRPGIVHRVASRLAERDINICDLESSLSKEGDLYVMVMEVHRPDSIDPGTLEDRLEDLSGELDVTIRVQELESYSL